MFQIESAVKFAGSVPSVLKSVSEVIGKISDPKSRDSIASMVSPSTILNKSISSERSFAGVSIPLSEAKALAKRPAASSTTSCWRFRAASSGAICWSAARCRRSR